MDPAQALEASVLAQQQPMLAAMAQGESEVQRFYKNCSVFLTGGSGFLGKQLLEKLLRSCQIAKVYMLIRPKKGKGVNERIQEVLRDSCFDALRKQQPAFSEKITAIEGDVSAIKLGIKDNDWDTLIEEVDIIFHVAATTKFDEPLQSATFINVRGTREAVLLGKACKHLRSYVHVSTAYSHATTHAIGKEVKEEFYKSPIQPDSLIAMAETVEVDRLNGLTEGLIKDWPNTYTFTKAVAEELVRTSTAGLPVAIVRPAIVLSTYREPTPGWLEKTCMYAATGIFTGGALGLIQVSIIDPDKDTGFIPCDYVNNAIIVAARETAASQARGGDDTKIYTVCSTHRNSVTYAKVSHTLNTEVQNILSPKALYYVCANFTRNQYVFTICSYMNPIIPAYVAEFICLLIGKDTRLVKLLKRLPSLFKIFSYFTLNDWNFTDDNVDNLFRSLTKQDQDIFNFDVTDINWTEMILVECIGIRKYVLKDGLKDTKYATKKQKFFKIAYYMIMGLYAYCAWKSLCFILFLMSSLFINLNKFSIFFSMRE